MDLRVIDRSRTVTYVPTKWPPAADADLFEVVRDVLRHAPNSSIEARQVEIVCDREFLQALDHYAVTHKEASFTQLNDGEHLPSFDGCPILVTD